MTFTIIIATRNRSEDLRHTCEKLITLAPPPCEVLICADACTDATVEMLRSRFPRFKLIQNQTALGSIPSRDRLMRIAEGDVVLSLDDDSYPIDNDFLRKLEKIWAVHPAAAVITFPELRNENQFSSPSKTSASPGHYVSAYANCAAAVRREFYLSRPGFPHFFVHMYEEPDYALQCYAAGAQVWFEPSLVIRHHLSATHRDHLRRHHQNARNELWSVWLRCPWPQLPFVSAFRVWRQFRYAWRQGITWAIGEPIWWYQALSGIPNCCALRRPVPWHIYFSWMRLARRPLFDKQALRTLFHPAFTE